MLFTKRHERQLSEIKALDQDLNRYVMEALEGIGRIRDDHSHSVAKSVRAEIDALAARYELGAGAADALQGLVRLADWRQPNFVPKSDPDHRLLTEKPRTGTKQRRAAATMLAESLSALDLEPVRAAGRMVDIGSGAGFPGLVLAIALPGARVTLVEKSDETCRFLRRAITELGLDHVEVVGKQLKGWSEGTGAYDVVTSRNVFPPDMMVDLCAPLLAPGGAVVLWQRERRDLVKEDLAADAAGMVGLRFAQVYRSEYRLDKRVAVHHLNLYLKPAGSETQPG